MKIFFNNQGQVDLADCSPETRVQDYLEALNLFLEENPLHCFDCEHNCCRQDWEVELDYVFVSRLLDYGISYNRLFGEIMIQGKSGVPVFRKMPCSFLDQQGRCRIYSLRAFTCRAYICYNKTIRMSVFEDIVKKALSLPLKARYLSYLNRDLSVSEEVKKLGLQRVDHINWNRSDYGQKLEVLYDRIAPLLSKYERGILEDLNI